MVTVKREAEFFDEFYTQYETIESELKHYNFEGKSVYCNCDNYRESKFFEYFFKSFKRLGLKRLVSIGLMDAFYADITNPDELTVKPCTFDNTSFAGLGLTHKLLEECDIVVTNPPFSKWRIFYSIIKDKDFIILGNYNIINYPEVFRDILDDKLHFGYNVNQSVKFLLPDGTLSKSASSITWFTSFRRDIKPLKLTKTFNILDYPIINNYKYNEEPVINCNKVSDIPDRKSVV